MLFFGVSLTAHVDPWLACQLSDVPCSLSLWCLDLDLSCICSLNLTSICFYAV